MIKKELFGELTPDCFERGESFDGETFVSLIAALQKQQRNLWKTHVIMTASMCISPVLAFGIGGVDGNSLALLCIFSALIFVGLLTRKTRKTIKSARRKLGITSKDIGAAVRKVKKEAEQRTAELASAPFAGKEGFDKREFAALLSAVRKQRQGLWTIPLLWIVALFLTMAITLSVGSAVKVKFATEFTEERIAIIICLLSGILLSRLWGRLSSRPMETVCAKLGIAPGEVGTAVRQAKNATNPPKKDRIKTVWLILAIVLYVVLLCAFIPEIDSDAGGFLVLGLSLAGIIGTILVYRKKRAGRWLTLLPSVILFAANLVSDDMMKNGVWIGVGVFFIIPYFVFIRYFLYRNNMYRPFGKYPVYGAYILLLAALTVQLTGKTYRTIGSYYCGMKSVQSKEGRWGYFDVAAQKEAIPCIYDEAMNFGAPPDVAWYDHKDALRAKVRLNGKWGMVDKYGKECIPCMYDDLNRPDSIMPALKDGKWGFVDLNNREILPFAYDSLYQPYPAHPEYRVRLDGKWGAVDKKGRELIPCTYGSVVELQEILNEQAAAANVQAVASKSPKIRAMKIASFDRGANSFDLVDAATGEKLTYRRLVIDNVEPVKINCIVKDGMDMLQFVMQERKALGTRQEGGQTVTEYSGEWIISFSAYASLKYKLEDGVLTILYK
jgi:hypothetical protein